MIFWWWSTRRSGCAASMPSRASTTTSFGSLISFFMSIFSRMVTGGSGRGLAEARVLRIGGVDPRGNGAVGRRVGDEAVGERGQHAGEELGGQVDRELLPLHGAARDLPGEKQRPTGGGRGG